MSGLPLAHEAPTNDIQAAAIELAERSAAAQGLPARVTDAGVLERVARHASPTEGR